MKLEKIALITENSKLARFFELELALLPYKLSPLSTIAEADSEYDCLIVDSDTVKDVVGGFSCPVITVSSRFERVEVFPHSRTCTLPYPVPVCEIVRLLRDVECDIFDERVAERDYNTVYVIDHNTNSIIVENLQLKLTPSELAVLDALCSSSGRLVERERISALLGASEGNIADVYICRLRKKLEVPLNPKLIFAERGRGYRTVLKIKK